MADDLAAAHAQAYATASPHARTADASRTGSPAPGPDPTKVAPRYTPRRNVNPAARRRSIVALVAAVAFLGAMVAAAIVLSAGPTVLVPRLTGLTKSTVRAKLRKAHIRADFLSHFSWAKEGTAVGQTPVAGTRVKQDSVIQVVFSKGPAPVAVPRLVGESTSAAVAKLHRIALKAEIKTVPAPGTAPGQVTAQSTPGGHHLRVHSTVVLSVAETPTWKVVTSFSGEGSGHSVPVHIRGSQWRVVYSMSYDGTCDFVLFCNGPSAQVLGVSTNSTDTSFDLNEGDSQTRVFKTGAGAYQILVKPGWDSARWSITVEDWL
jgi:hypothetical protein